MGADTCRTSFLHQPRPKHRNGSGGPLRRPSPTAARASAGAAPPATSPCQRASTSQATSSATSVGEEEHVVDAGVQPGGGHARPTPRRSAPRPGPARRPTAPPSRGCASASRCRSRTTARRPARQRRRAGSRRSGGRGRPGGGRRPARRARPPGRPRRRLRAGPPGCRPRRPTTARRAGPPPRRGRRAGRPPGRAARGREPSPCRSQWVAEGGTVSGRPTRPGSRVHGVPARLPAGVSTSRRSPTSVSTGSTRERATVSRLRSQAGPDRAGHRARQCARPPCRGRPRPRPGRLRSPGTSPRSTTVAAVSVTTSAGQPPGTGDVGHQRGPLAESGLQLVERSRVADLAPARGGPAVPGDAVGQLGTAAGRPGRAGAA